MHDTPSYRAARKREIYRAALETATRDGTITERERDTMAVLAEKLGMSPVEVRRAERAAGPAAKAR